jgi:hypothetical protein
MARGHIAEIRAGLKLFAKEVLPVLKTWRTQETARAAE